MIITGGSGFDSDISAAPKEAVPGAEVQEG